jgi:hypothetical protein
LEGAKPSGEWRRSPMEEEVDAEKLRRRRRKKPTCNGHGC